MPGLKGKVEVTIDGKTITGWVNSRKTFPNTPRMVEYEITFPSYYMETVQVAGRGNTQHAHPTPTSLQITIVEDAISEEGKKE